LISKLQAGIYTFRLTVTDNDGATAYDDVTIVVHDLIEPANLAPVANAGKDLSVTLPLDSIILTGKGTDADGVIVTYHWTILSAPSAYYRISSDQPTFKLSKMVKGQYVFELTVTDDRGAVGKDTVALSVYPAANINPIVDAGADITITLPLDSVILQGRASDPDGNIASSHWRQIAGAVQSEIAEENQLKTMISKLKEGTYSFELTVADDSAAMARDTVKITVQAEPVKPPVANQPPVAHAGKDIEVGSTQSGVTLSGYGIDSDGIITGYKWSQISGPATASVLSPLQAQTSISGLLPGIYKFEFVVMDDKGATGKDTIVVTVDQPLVQPILGLNAGEDQTIILPEDSVKLEAITGNNTDLNIHYQWRMISGPSSYKFKSGISSKTVVKQLVEGKYQFVCTATDTYNNTVSDTVNVVVMSIPTSIVTVFPNPSKGVFHVQIKADTKYNNTPLTIYDLTGKTVYFESFTRVGNIKERSIDLSALPRGMYIIEVGVSLNEKISCKIIKE
jgi:hypothetical protein